MTTKPIPSPPSTVIAPTKRPHSPWLCSLLLSRGRPYFRRFIYLCHRLTAGSHRIRRGWLRRAGLSLAGVALLLALGRSPARANTINVAGGQVGISDNGQCSLIEALVNANDSGDGLVYDDCAAGDPAGVDVVSLPEAGNFLLSQALATYYDSPTGLPLVESAIVIEGNGATIGRDPAADTQFRLLAVSESGDLTLNDLVLRDGFATGSYGGGALINGGGKVTLNDTEVIGNTAARVGGGLYNYGGGTVTINGGLLAGNRAAFGGGVSSHGGYLTISGGLLTGNQASSGGGGVHAILFAPLPQPRPPQDTVTLLDTVLDGNTAASYGGGLHIFSTSATIRGSTFRGNHAGNDGGGADFHTDNSYITIENSRFVENTAADNGGGIASIGANMTLRDSTISGNRAAFGGGLYVGASDSIISRITVDGNYALLAGGGVRTLAGTELQMSNSTVSGNVVGSPVGFAGGFNHHTSTMTLSNSTVIGNSAAEFGGGVRNFLGTATLRRNLIAGNSAEIGREVDNLNGTLIANGRNLFGFAGNAGVNGFAPGVTDFTPVEALAAILEAELADNGGETLTHTHALLPGSPALDVAPNTACAAAPVNGVDQRGLPRSVDGDGSPSSSECDVGAFELQPNGPAPTATPSATPSLNPSPTPSLTPSPTPPPTPIPGGRLHLPIVVDVGS